jgi:hypothetical protein
MFPEPPDRAPPLLDALLTCICIIPGIPYIIGPPMPGIGIIPAAGARATGCARAGR